jgi:DNA-binding MarR family transcriptional regulator
MNGNDEERERIAELEMRERELAAALAELDHQARRLGDRIERDGGAVGSTASERAALDRTRRLNREELEQVRAELRRLRGGDGPG